MNRYVIKINNSTFVKDIHWIVGEIPIITTDKFENAALYREEYLNYPVHKNGFGEDATRKEVILQYFPHIKVVRIKIVLDEGD